MKKFTRVISAIFYLLISILLITTISSSILKRPLLMTTIRSNSMYPLLERGDIVFVKPVSTKNINTGDIVIFKAETGGLASNGLIMHRIVNGNNKEGFITKGDANEYTDQDNSSTGVIMPDFIYSKAITIGKYPLKIPLIGHITLWAENLQKTPYLLPGIAFLLAIIVAISELTSKKSKKKRSPKLDMPLIYFFSGLTITILIGATMLTTSQHIIIPYEVSDSSEGVMTGSNVGIIKKGDTIYDRSLSDLSNKGFYPILVSVTSSDPQITFNYKQLSLKPGQETNLTMDVSAIKSGKHEASVWVGMFLPLLPMKIIYSLAQINYWLALIVISLIPGLPLMVYPLIDGKMRRSTTKEIRRGIRRIQNKISISFTR